MTYTWESAAGSDSVSEDTLRGLRERASRLRSEKPRSREFVDTLIELARAGRTTETLSALDSAREALELSR
jgi:hypothetical protein